MICNKCNHKLPEDSEFCQYCGEKIEKAVVEPVETVVAEPIKVGTPELDINKISPEEAAKYLFAEQLGEEYIPPENQHLDTTIKTKYCSRCGSPVDNDTKICTGCGKQYFRGLKFNKFSITILIISLLLITSIVMNVWQYNEIDSLSNQKENLENRISELEDQSVKDFNKLYFFERFAEIVANDGTNKYHKWGCSQLDTSNGFWIFNTDAAKEDYYECQYCH